jgi:hypothetical protein
MGHDRPNDWVRVAPVAQYRPTYGPPTGLLPFLAFWGDQEAVVFFLVTLFFSNNLSAAFSLGRKEI